MERFCFPVGCCDWLLKLRVDGLKPFLVKVQGFPMLTVSWLRSYEISIALIVHGSTPPYYFGDFPLETHGTFNYFISFISF